MAERVGYFAARHSRPCKLRRIQIQGSVPQIEAIEVPADDHRFRLERRTRRHQPHLAGCRCLRGGDGRQLGDRPLRLLDFDGLRLFDGGQISVDDYMQGLAEFAGCTVDEAVLLHAGIHIAEFPGILALVTELHANGIRTGCLSNINEPHWSFVSSSRYPGVAAIQMKMASFLVELSKPSPAIFDKYCATFGLEPQSILFFDDGAPNVAAAASCGWNARHINAPGDTDSQLRGHLREFGVL